MVDITTLSDETTKAEQRAIASTTNIDLYKDELFYLTIPAPVSQTTFNSDLDMECPLTTPVDSMLVEFQTTASCDPLVVNNVNDFNSKNDQLEMLLGREMCLLTKL